MGEDRTFRFQRRIWGGCSRDYPVLAVRVVCKGDKITLAEL